MASTSLTELYPSHGLKPCRVILERIPVELDPVQNPRTVKPPLQPPEVAKTRKRRHSQAKCDIPEKLQAFAPPSQASTQLEELVGSHVDDDKIEKEAGEEVTATPQASEIRIKERGGASCNGSRNEHSLTPASQVGTSLEEFYTERVDDSGKRRAAGEASTVRKPRKDRQSCSKRKHGVIKRRRPCRKLAFTLPAPSVRIGHSEELLVDPANERGLGNSSENGLLDMPQVSTAYSAMECKEADRDELYCDECGVDHPGECPVHGPLLYIEDTHVPKGTPLRANKTLPEGLDIRRSAMRGAQFGVFAMKPLAKRTCFGPYEGVRRKTNSGNGYTWKVYGRDGEAYMVDARPLNHSNWMRYVNCSLTEDEQNMVAFQRNGNIYYRTRRDIAACEELVVWYGNSFAKDLGLIDYKGQSSEPKTPDPNQRPIFKCDSCNDAFSVQKDLADHKLRYHVEKSPGRFECRLCPRTCQTRWDMKRHVLTHTKHKPFTCHECGKSFTQSSSLKIHLRIHTGERPYECSTCGQCFCDPSVLSRHQRLHTGHSKVHACPECGRSFSLRSDVKRHLRTHTGDRPYTCTICKQLFRDLGYWRRHERFVHKKEYNLKCPFCGKGAVAMWNLRQHVRARHTPKKREE